MSDATRTSSPGQARSSAKGLPFLHIDGDILRRRDLSPGTKFVFGALRIHLGSGESRNPGVELLAAELGLTPRAVCKSIGRLERLGLLQTQRRSGTRNQYALLPTEEQSSPVLSPDGGQTEEQSSPPPGNKVPWQQRGEGKQREECSANCRDLGRGLREGAGRAAGPHRAGAQRPEALGEAGRRRPGGAAPPDGAGGRDRWT
jgi:hypothetical protein